MARSLRYFKEFITYLTVNFDFDENEEKQRRSHAAHRNSIFGSSTANRERTSLVLEFDPVDRT